MKHDSDTVTIEEHFIMNQNWIERVSGGESHSTQHSRCGASNGSAQEDWS